MIHELKTDGAAFHALIRGRKTFEIRKNDRGFQVDDTLILRETEWTGAQMAEGKPLVYTGRTANAKVRGVMNGPVYGLMEGWAILSVELRASSFPAKDTMGDTFTIHEEAGPVPVEQIEVGSGPMTAKSVPAPEWRGLVFVPLPKNAKSEHWGDLDAFLSVAERFDYMASYQGIVVHRRHGEEAATAMQRWIDFIIDRQKARQGKV